MGLMRRAQATASLLAAVLATQVVLAAIGGSLYADLHNTLLRNGHWNSGKLALAKRVMGAFNYVNSRQTLAHECLHLGRWHGYQEVIYHEPLDLGEVSFRFQLQENSYLYFIFNKTEAGFSALRLGTQPWTSLYVTVAPSGEFLSSTPLPEASPVPGPWSRITVTFSADRFTATLDGKSIGSFAATLASPQSFGFRGCAHDVLVDDVLVHRADGGAPIQESFRNTHDFWRVAGFGIVVFLIIDAATLAFLARRKLLSPRPLFLAVTAYFGLAAAAGLAFGVYRAFLSNRSATRRPDEEEMAWRTAEVLRVREDIRQAYPERATGITRILVVGSSQTWGAGAAREQDTFVRRTEELLSSDDGNLYECINAGISGSYSRELLEIYREEWLALEPSIVV